MKQEKKKRTAKVLFGFMIIGIILLVIFAIFIGIIWKVNPEILREAKHLLSPPQAANQTIIIENQTVTNNTTIDQKTNFWDVIKQIVGGLFAIVIFTGIIIAIIIFTKKVKKPLGKDEVIKIHREILSVNEGHYRLEKSSPNDDYGGTFLYYHKYYDGVGKEASSHPRAVSFWSLQKVPENTPLAMISRHLLIWLDTSIKNRGEVLDNCTGPIAGETWKDWQKWKHDQNYNVIGAKSSPMVNMDILTPEQQRDMKERWEEATKQAMFGSEQ
jgi:hypothetical protein